MKEMDIQTHTKAVFEPTQNTTHHAASRWSSVSECTLKTIKKKTSWIDIPKAWIPTCKDQRPDSQQSTRSQMIKCMKIYCNIDKTVKSAHKQTFKGTYLMKGCVYVVFLLFRPYKHHFCKFRCFGFSPTKKEKENSAVLRCPKKMLKKLASFHSNRLKTSLEYRAKIFLPWKCQFSSKHWAMVSKGREM